ncbi:MAG: peptidoglycan DD-metalloendopeptidase family protein [Flavobacteriales bacterium]|nr:peptidoglycan DD-metalloendopeptidase family protein [Flavobacteriales bacterium]
MLKLIKHTTFILLILFSLPTFSQSKKDLKEKKEQIEKDIKYTNKLLEKTKKNKEKSLTHLKTLSKQVKNREELLQMLNIEIGFIQRQIGKTTIKIADNQFKIQEKQEELKRLQQEYAKMIYYASKNKSNYDNWVFIFSSKSFNQAYKRIKYLKQYTQHRKTQAEIITKTKEDLSNEIVNLENQKADLQSDKENKKALIISKKTEVTELEIQKKDKKILIKKLKKSEKYFKKELQKQQQVAKELEEKIRKIIEEEIRKARAKEKKGDAKGYSLTPEAKALSDDFLENKGKLPWPLDKGIIVQRFGKQQHEVFKNIETYNNGIDIATDKGSKVRAIFDGKISRIFLIKGEGKVILINHGEYFSVYSGLKEVSVKAGEKIIAKQQIGVVITNENKQKTHLHFEIWKNYDKQNPSLWLYKAH